MATSAQLPGSLNVAFNRTDDYATLVDLSVSIVGYTWTAEIYSIVTGQVLGNPTVSVVNAAAGQFNLVVSDALAATLPPGTLGLRIGWVAPGDTRRRAFEGICEVHR